jgi:hypothetical protein
MILEINFMDYCLYKVGNSVIYNGPLDDYRNQVGLIQSVNDDSFILSIKKRYPKDAPEQTIVAYPEGILPIRMNIDILNSFGFALDERTKVISNGNVNIINVSYEKISKDFLGNDAPMLDIKGFRLVTEKISVDRNEDEVMKNTVDVNTLHCLQNYYKINFGKDLYL